MHLPSSTYLTTTTEQERCRHRMTRRGDVGPESHWGKKLALARSKPPPLETTLKKKSTRDPKKPAPQKPSGVPADISTNHVADLAAPSPTDRHSRSMHLEFGFLFVMAACRRVSSSSLWTVMDSGSRAVPEARQC